jgi:hypothetical protein
VDATERHAGSRFVKVDPSDPKAVARTKALISLLYTVRENSRKTPLHRIRSNVRFRELETVFAHCWRGTELTDDDAGRDHLYIAACHLWHLGKKCGPIVAIRAWVAHGAPWCGPDELAALIDRVEANPRMWSADELAHELGLYIMPFVVRQALGLTTIGSLDVDKKGRECRQKEISKQRSTNRRRKSGKVPRAVYLASHVANRTKPWVALGISKATYYRRKAREAHGETSPNAAKIGEILLSSDLSHDVEAPSEEQSARDSRAPQAPRRLAPADDDTIDVVVGVGLAPPPRSSGTIARLRGAPAGMRPT